MNKLQTVSRLIATVSFLTVLSAQAQSGFVEKQNFEYQCHQDPLIIGGSTELTVAYGATFGDGFVATVTNSATTMPPRSSTETFEHLDRNESPDNNSKTYEGTGFKLTVSENAISEPRMGRVFEATLITADTGPQGRKLFCVQGDGEGVPGVTGSN